MTGAGRIPPQDTPYSPWRFSPGLPRRPMTAPQSMIVSMLAPLVVAAGAPRSGEAHLIVHPGELPRADVLEGHLLAARIPASRPT